MLSSKSITGIEEIRFEAASLLGRIHIEQVRSMYSQTGSCFM